MNQHPPYDYPPPPPSPRAVHNPQHGPLAGGADSLYQNQQRRGVQPPAITTSFHNSPLVSVLQTPIPQTAPAGNTSGAVPRYTPGVSSVSALTPRPPPGSLLSPNTPMEPYNPRQWSGRGPVSGSQMVFARQNNLPLSTRDATGMEAAMPSPPPPYTPETPERDANRASPTQTAGYTNSPLVVESRPSPQPTMSTAFPPPPPQSSRHRERSSSGLGNRGIFSGLSNLRGKQPIGQGQQVQQPFPRQLEAFPGAISPTPPAARRAASTGHMQPQHIVLGPSDRLSPEANWQPGMPLPGPPPGPPPPGTRSQSLNRVPGTSSRTGSQSSDDGSGASNITVQRRAAQPSTLGPVPPTPANWTDGDPNPQPLHESRPAEEPEQDGTQPTLRINTGAGNRDSLLARRPAHRRDGSAQGIRERRSRSRQARNGEAMSPDDDESKPNDLIFSSIDGAISRRREHTRHTSLNVAGPSSAPPSASLPAQEQPGSARSARKLGHVMTPPYTPAVNNQDGDASKRSTRVPGSATSEKQMSHNLQTPNGDGAVPAPLSPGRPPSSGSNKQSNVRLDSFALQALERHRSFLEKEASAASDEERLELFASFIVHESRLRRDRYSTAYNAMAGEIVDLTRDMWRSYTRNSRRAATPSTMSSVDPALPSWASDGINSAHPNGPGSASSFGEFTPATDSASIPDPLDTPERSESRQWGETFKPSLSPIPSMAVSTVPDEDSSRGRQPSRWWEQSDATGSIGRPDRIQKSHRETKYMGIDPAVLQGGNQPAPEVRPGNTPTPGASKQTFGYGPNEYPPEKVGWHEESNFNTPMATPARRDRHSIELGGSVLDVSRLVTLPPPYPRHHPAINNAHPELADLRNEHRQLAELEDIQKIKDEYMEQDFALQRKQQDSAKEQKSQLRARIQSKIADGSMSFAQAAEEAAKFEAEEPERGKANARGAFDLFETKMAHPMNTFLTERIGRADAAIKALRNELECRAQVSDPNQAQEEGDGVPERLEKLTLLKWFFEVREQYHREMFDLHAQRSEKYSDVILTPYRIAKLQNKIDDATRFFAKDSMDRQVTFAKDAMKRYEELESILDKNVGRGVEDQLSAFWDIAPSLNQIIASIPAENGASEIFIPPQEYEENPSYNDHPLQYLYSVLSHAEKSAYQFIESQINLLCLLHEVRTATANTRVRQIEVEQSAAAPRDEKLQAEMEDAKRLEEARLTDDLKEKVGDVEAQWREALGDVIDECKGRVRGWLEESGGWEDGLEG